MGVPTSVVGYTSATTRRGDHEGHEGHVVAVGKERKKEKKTQIGPEYYV
jgi:co-chaperonin GroES (HSP10)